MSKKHSLQSQSFTPQPASSSSPQKGGVSGIKTSQIIHQEAHYSGPIPPSDEMERYHRINPELVKQIVQMAVDEQKERFAIERSKLNLAEAESHRADEALRINKRNSLISIIVSYLLVLAFLVAIVLLAGYFHAYIPATVLGIGGLGTIVYFIIYGSRVGKS